MSLLRFLVVVFIFFVYSVVNAQENLVINSSFEDTIAFGGEGTEFTISSYCPPWFAAQLSPDYYSISYSISSIYSDSINPAYINLGARTGYGYAGEFLFTNYFFDAQELLGGLLSSPLLHKKKYCLELYYKRGISNDNRPKLSCDGLGIYFTTDSINVDTCCIYYLNPQIQNAPGNVLYDTTWTLFSGNFIASGGEKYFMIGNFKNDSLTKVDPKPNLPNSYCYYFFDDISVWLCDADTIAHYPFLQNENAVTNLKPPPEPLIIPTLISGKDLYWQFIHLQPNTSLKLYNALGQLAFSSFNYQNNLSVSFLAAGVYFYEVVEENGERVNGKVVVVR